MAVKLIEQVAGKFEPERFRDTYTDALRKVIRAKERGKPVSVAAEEAEPEAPVDLMAALRESVEAARKSRPKRRKSRAKKAA